MPFSKFHIKLIPGASRVPSLAGALYSLSITIFIFLTKRCFAKILWEFAEYSPLVLNINAGFSTSNSPILSIKLSNRIGGCVWYIGYPIIKASYLFKSKLGVTSSMDTIVSSKLLFNLFLNFSAINFVLPTPEKYKISICLMLIPPIFKALIEN